MLPKTTPRVPWPVSSSCYWRLSRRSSRRSCGALLYSMSRKQKKGKNWISIKFQGLDTQTWMKYTEQKPFIIPPTILVARGIIFSSCPSTCLLLCSLYKFSQAVSTEPVEGNQSNFTQTLSSRHR